MYLPLQFLSLSLSLSQIFFSLFFLLCLPRFVQISITLASWKFSLANSSLNLRRIEFSSKSLSLSLSLSLLLPILLQRREASSIFRLSLSLSESLFFYKFFFSSAAVSERLSLSLKVISSITNSSSSSPLQRWSTKKKVCNAVMDLARTPATALPKLLRPHPAVLSPDPSLSANPTS